MAAKPSVHRLLSAPVGGWCRRTEQHFVLTVFPTGLVRSAARWGGTGCNSEVTGAFVQRLTLDSSEFMGVFFCPRLGENPKALRDELGLQGP